jgi:WD40 repeat protein
LHVSIENLFDKDVILATAANRRLGLVDLDGSLLFSQPMNNDAPILSCTTFTNTYNQSRYIVATTMSGQLLLMNLSEDEDGTGDFKERRDHSKYVVKVVTFESTEGVWIATAGWDQKVFIYYIEYSHFADTDNLNSLADLPPPLGSITIQTNPESILLIRDPSEALSAPPLLILSRRDSTFLHYYKLPSTPTSEDVGPDNTSKTDIPILGRQNLAPHANSWTAFHPSSLAISPLDPTLLAVATSSVPHQRLMLIRLLIPSGTTLPAPTTPAMAVRRDLAAEDASEAAIVMNVSTLAPQTPYSTPIVTWRPSGTGVWTNGDDGCIRGVETKSGKVVKILKGGHEEGVKVRALWCGWVDVHGDGKVEEWVVSGGFDRKLVIWKS